MKHIRITLSGLVVAIAVVFLVFACGKDTFILTAVPNDPSYGSVSGGGEYKNGDKATVTATPYSGYRFVNWDDGMTENPRTVIMHENTNLTANFGKAQTQTYSITVSSNNSGWGSVSGGGTYPSGSTVTLKATPYSGYSFERWNDGVTSATRTITVTGNASYTAYFKVNGGGNTASMTVSFGGTTWTATSFIGTYWTDDGTYVIGGKTNNDYPWLRMQLQGISTGTYTAILDTNNSFYWLNNNVNIVQYYESTYLTAGESTYQYGDWQGWNLTVYITSLTSNTISFNVYGYMYNAVEGACASCPEYTGSFAGATKRYISIQGNNIPFTSQTKGSHSIEGGDVIKLLNESMESTPQR